MSVKHTKVVNCKFPCRQVIAYNSAYKIAITTVHTKAINCHPEYKGSLLQ